MRSPRPVVSTILGIIMSNGCCIPFPLYTLTMLQVYTFTKRSPIRIRQENQNGGRPAVQICYSVPASGATSAGATSEGAGSADSVDTGSGTDSLSAAIA